MNRITASTNLEGANANTFKTGYEYDAGGNITKLKRWDMDGNQFDAMEYNYENTASNQDYKTNTNKLRWVDDTEPVADHTSDIDDQQTDNYTYDDIGNLISDKAEEIERIEWNSYRRIQAIYRVPSSLKPDLQFEYDVYGNRIIKRVIEKNGDIKETFYVRESGGNLLAVYENIIGNSFALSEQYVYGSSKIGVYLPSSTEAQHYVGLKGYECIDHLNNVRVVFSDKKVNGNVEVVLATDYFPFGMEARNYSNGIKNRYSFQNQEKDEELWSGAINFKYRIEDPRLGRFFSVDPLFLSFPWNSPYVFSENNVIHAVELEGLEKQIIIHIPKPDKPIFSVHFADQVEHEYPFSINGKTKMVPEHLKSVPCFCPEKMAMAEIADIAPNYDSQYETTLELTPVKYYEMLAFGVYEAVFVWEYEYSYIDPITKEKVTIEKGKFEHTINEKKQVQEKAVIYLPGEADEAAEDNAKARGRKMYREKTRGANKLDRKVVDGVAKELKLDKKQRKEFGKYIEQVKKAEGRGGSDNYTRDELLEIGKEFIEQKK